MPRLSSLPEIYSVVSKNLNMTCCEVGEREREKKREREKEKESCPAWSSLSFFCLRVQNFNQIWNFLAIIYSNKLLFPSFLSSSSGTLIAYMLNCLMLSHKSLLLCYLIFFSDFSLNISFCINSVPIFSSSLISSSSVPSLC